MFPVVKSESALIFDTLPDLKVQYFRLREVTPSIYTYAQLYILNDSLRLSLRAFEQAPPPQSTVTFGIATQNGDFLKIELAPQTAQITESGGETATLSCENISRFAGEDERGWYWGAELCIGKEHLAKIGLMPEVGAEFTCAVFKTHANLGIIGAPYPLPQNGEIFSPALFSKLVVTSF